METVAQGGLDSRYAGGLVRPGLCEAAFCYITSPREAYWPTGIGTGSTLAKGFHFLLLSLAERRSTAKACQEVGRLGGSSGSVALR
jgi:hypothetical protein